jgi:hypothetical protein
VPQRANQTAIIWEGDNPEVSQKVTYQQLHDEVAKLANGLKKPGIVKSHLCSPTFLTSFRFLLFNSIFPKISSDLNIIFFIQMPSDKPCLDVSTNHLFPNHCLNIF